MNDPLEFLITSERSKKGIELGEKPVIAESAVNEDLKAPDRSVPVSDLSKTVGSIPGYLRISSEEVTPVCHKSPDCIGLAP